MARVDRLLAAGLVFFSVVIAISAHPPHAGEDFKATQATRPDRELWRRLGEDDDAGVDPVADDWSAGFGRRISVIQRRQGSSLLQPQPEQQAIEASTKLISVSQQLRPKAEASVAPAIKPEASTIRLIRKRLPDSRPSNKNATDEFVLNATIVNDTVQPTVVTEQSIIPSKEVEIQQNSTTIFTPDQSINNASSVVIPEEIPQPIKLNITVASTTTSTTSAPSIMSISPLANKPPWRVRMEQNQNNRRGQSTSKPTGNNETSSETESVTITPSPSTEPKVSVAEWRNSTVVIPTSVPLIESSQSEVVASSTVLQVVSSTINRPIQSSRVLVTSSNNTPWTPIVRLPIIGSRNIPAGTLKIQITSTRLPPAIVPVVEPKLLEPVVEDNVVKTAQSASSSTTSRTTTTRTTTTSTTPSTTTESTTNSPSTTRKAPVPTPVMHSLEDILQRLVPAKDDNFGGNPFLVAPVRSNSAVTTADDANEIVSVDNLRSSSTRTGSSNDNPTSRNSSNSGNSGWSDPSETQTTTSIYIVGVVAVIPLAGVILWVVRVQLHKRRERLNESETSSETGFRKRLPPVALTPSKHARLFYGANDKEDLVSGSVSPGGNSGGGKSSPAPSPWEFTRSRLRLQTLIGEGNFGQVWKAEAEDICGCQGTLLVAVKTVKDGAAAKEKQELLREMRIMQQVGPHPNVVALLGCCTEQEPFLLIMEYVMYGRLLTFLRDHRTHQTYYNYSSDSEALTSRDLTTFAYCVAKGMEYIYSKGVVHRDLAARNVLVDHNKLCKVADFGLSRSVRDTAGEMYEQRVKGALPIRWMAPESLIQSVFTQKSDVWSFGILVWEIVTLGSTPYPGMEAREVMRRVKDGHRLERPSHCRPEFYRLMSRCWHSDPLRRPDFGELKSELGQLLDDSDGYIDLDNFQESIYVPLESPSDESEKI